MPCSEQSSIYERRAAVAPNAIQWAISEWPQSSVSNQAECEVTDIKTTFHSHAHKTHFHMKGFALRAKREFLELGNGLFNKAS